MGFAPVTNPAFVVVVTMNGTSGSAGYGRGAAAAPSSRPWPPKRCACWMCRRIFPTLSPEPARVQPGGYRRSGDCRSGARPSRTSWRKSPRSKQPALRPRRGRGSTGRRCRISAARRCAPWWRRRRRMGLPVLLDGSGMARAQVPAAGKRVARRRAGAGAVRALSLGLVRVRGAPHMTVGEVLAGVRLQTAARGGACPIAGSRSRIRFPAREEGRLVLRVPRRARGRAELRGAGDATPARLRW